MVKYNGRKIIYSFQFGGYVSNKIKKFFLVFFSLCLLSGLIPFLILVFTLENAFNQEIVWVLFGFIIILGIIPFLIMFIFYLLRKHNDKQIYTWIMDENIFQCRVIPWMFSERIVKLTSIHRFGIDFTIGENQYRKVSSGYDGFFKSLNGQSIEILYSPKYDQVMVLGL